MPMDAVFLHGLTQELTQSLTGARIDKVQQPERDLLLLSVRTTWRSDQATGRDAALTRERNQAANRNRLRNIRCFIAWNLFQD